jgi:hypothetical protein
MSAQVDPAKLDRSRGRSSLRGRFPAFEDRDDTLRSGLLTASRLSLCFRPVLRRARGARRRRDAQR